MLDDAVDQPVALAAQRAAERRDHAGRDGRLEAERVADRDRELADPRREGAVDRQVRQRRGRRQRGRVDPDDGEVGRRIVADDLRLGASRPPACARGSASRADTTWLLVIT